MTVNEVRKRFLSFYEKRGHTVIPSAPIVPENDPTTLFTSSGMQPLVPYLLGKDHPEGKRIVNSQMSVRTGDIEEVGDNRHLTFFEMLGNWSLGDYFKQEQLPWIFEFLISKENGLGFDPNKLYVTVFDGDKEAGMDLDTESVGIWLKLFTEKGIEAKLIRVGTEEDGYGNGMQGGRIFSYGAKNWWSRAGVPAKMPPGEPGGPDSEIFYDFGTLHDPKWGKECHVNCDCGRFVEICNSVFMQFVKNADGSFSELPKKNVDFGGGLERLTVTTLGSSDVYDADVFSEARTVLESASRKKYSDETRSFRIILDHVRAVVFMFASGVRPSNSEQGYVLRRLIRRAALQTKNLGVFENEDQHSLGLVAQSIISAYKTSYPDLFGSEKSILTGLCEEEKQFRKTLDQGMRELGKMMEAKYVTGAQASVLSQTFGFPYELTKEVLAEHGTELRNPEQFEEKTKAHVELSRTGAAQKFAGGLADHAEQTVRYHTAHHLLLKALQIVLGPDVHQRGSNITSERLRIDFSYGAKMTPEQILEVERIVNEKIAEEIPVIRTDMKKEEAEKLGAEHEFGVKYPDTVSVYSVGSLDKAFSIEFCGGPHVSNTRELKGMFKILKEEASSAGVRRIKAVLQ